MAADKKPLFNVRSILKGERKRLSWSIGIKSQDQMSFCCCEKNERVSFTWKKVRPLQLILKIERTLMLSLVRHQTIESLNCRKQFYCSTALTSTGWVRMTIKPRHCPPSSKQCSCHWISAFFRKYLRSRESNLGPRGEKQVCYPLCYAAPPQVENSFFHSGFFYVQY